MRIIQTNSRKERLFGDLQPGDTFQMDGLYFIKTVICRDDEHKEINALELSNFSLVSIHPGDGVILVLSELVLK